LHCEALKTAQCIVEEIESRSHRTSDEERRLRHALEVQARCKESGRLFEQALQWILCRSHFKDDASLRIEDNLAQVIIGLRDLTFDYGPVLPGRTATPEWYNLSKQRANKWFAWHEHKRQDYLTVGLTDKDTNAMAAQYRKWTRLDFSEHSACHAYLLEMATLRQSLVPCIAMDLVKRFQADEAA